LGELHTVLENLEYLDQSFLKSSNISILHADCKHRVG
jgi:hypothetical protein